MNPQPIKSATTDLEKLKQDFKKKKSGAPLDGEQKGFLGFLALPGKQDQTKQIAGPKPPSIWERMYPYIHIFTSDIKRLLLIKNHDYEKEKEMQEVYKDFMSEHFPGGQHR